VHRGAGAYICGEETGLIESLEGKRPYPRIKPPYFPAALGLYMSPTIVNNVESLCHVKHILAMGGAEYAKLGTPNNTGTRILCVSGDVQKPGYYEVEVGKVTMGEVIDTLCGGLKPGRKLKAIIPGGSSSKVLRADEKYKLKDGREIGIMDIPMDFDTMAAVRHHGRLRRRHHHGRQPQHDLGHQQPERLLRPRELRPVHPLPRRQPVDEKDQRPHRRRRRQPRRRGHLETVANQIEGKTICAFGEAASWPTQSFIKKFRDELKGDCKPDLTDLNEETRGGGVGGVKTRSSFGTTERGSVV
jgi:NADH-quinone oxidoreductase subunit F